MNNPYWQTAGQKHHIDLSQVERLCFELVNIIGGSLALAEEMAAVDAEATKEGEPLPEIPRLWRVQTDLAEKTISGLLLQIGLMVRTYDDIMRESPDRDAYLKHSVATDGENIIGELDGGPLGLREACNKIVHAVTIRPLYEDVDAADAADRYWHLTGEVELAGRHRNADWSATLFMQDFVEIILDRIAFGNGE
jgi:hypothetical protein